MQLTNENNRMILNHKKITEYAGKALKLYTKAE